MLCATRYPKRDNELRSFVPPLATMPAFSVPPPWRGGGRQVEINLGALLTTA